MNQIELRQAIIDFPKQLGADLTVVNGDKLPAVDKFLVGGMGGSALAAGLLKVYQPHLDLLIHRDYGLPRVPDYFLNDGLLILSSYSGQTEEVLDVLQVALARGLRLAVIADAGVLLDEAKKHSLPHLDLPGGLPPRVAVGYMFNGLARLCLPDKALDELSRVVEQLAGEDLEPEGKRLAGLIGDRIPLVYSSTINYPLAYNWKIRFNETAKVPAFANCLPELNHNEMAASTGDFHYFFLRDPDDNERINKRFSLLKDTFQATGAQVEEINLPAWSPLAKIFWTVWLADWLTYHLALLRQVDPVEVPVIERFKKDLCATS